MNFPNSMRSGFKNFFVPNGRACRSEYWWWVLFYFCFIFGLGFIHGFAFNGQPGFLIFSIPAILVLLIPTLTLIARRLHDTNHSAWWMMSFLLLIPLTLAVHIVSGSSLWALIIEIVLIPFWFLSMLIWMCVDGTKGLNRFGNDPLNRTSVAQPKIDVERERDVGDYAKLEKLHDLQLKGVLTEQEFEQQKSFLLKGGR